MLLLLSLSLCQDFPDHINVALFLDWMPFVQKGSPMWQLQMLYINADQYLYEHFNQFAPLPNRGVEYLPAAIPEINLDISQPILQSRNKNLSCP